MVVNALKSILYTAVLWAVFLFGIPELIARGENLLGLTATRFESDKMRFVAVAVFLIASMIGFWSGYILVAQGEGTPMPLECTRRLVIAGPYPYIRNPMSTMGIVQGIAVGLYRGSILVIAYAFVGALLWNYVLRPWEEQDLRERFGREFETYRAHVRCWIPRLRAYDPRNL